MPDPDLEIRGDPRALDKEGPLEKEGGQSPKKVWSKNKGGGAGPPGPSPGSATDLIFQ